MPADSIPVLLVGAGAIGSFYASRLACALQTRVDVVCRSNFEAVKARGFSVTSPKFGEYRFVPNQTFSGVKEARKARRFWDFIIVATKALPDVSDDSESLEGLVGDNTAIVLIQNGLGIEAPYQKRFPRTTILSSVAIASVAQPSPGKITHNSFTRLSVGPWLAGTEHSSEAVNNANDKAKHFVKLLQEGGIEDAEAYDHTNLQFVRWNKIAINASMNPSSVLSNGADNVTLVTDSELSEHITGVMNEVLDTAPKVLGQPFPKGFPTPQQILKRTSGSPVGSKASMLLDWEAGKPMEVEVILGNPIRIAREHGLEMPRLQSLYALIAQANRSRQKKEYENEAGGSKL